MFDHDHHSDDDCNTTHPGVRAPQADDPMEISGIEVEGDPLVMLQCIVEEYARMGADLETIMRMFDDPFYQGPHGLMRAYGREFIRRRVEDILSRSGVMRVRVVEEAPATVEQAVALTIGRRAIAGRD